jgi:lysophospholipase L1-like esterase
MLHKFLSLSLIISSCLLLLRCTAPSGSSIKGTTFIAADDSLFAYTGRIDYRNPKQLRFAHTGVSIRFRFEGTVCVLHLKNKSNGQYADGTPYKNYYTIVVDNQKPQTYSVSNDDAVIRLKGLSKGVHEVLVFKRNEALVGEGIFEGIEIQQGATLLPLGKTKSRKIEFIGNSITCGYGNEGSSKDCNFSPETQNGYMAYGAITARRLNADYSAVAYSGRGIYRNYDGTTNETMALIYDRVFPDSIQSPKWTYHQWQPDAIVINLGTNDFATGIPDSVVFVNTYLNFLKRLRYYYPDAALFCIEAPMVSDSYPPQALSHTRLSRYIRAAQNRMHDIGEKNVHVFFPSRQKEEDWGCDYHPNTKRHEKMADELSKYIKTTLGW